MPKLTKQEVNAIAGKLHRELEEKIRLERLRVMHEYIPSRNYIEVESNYKRIEEINKQISNLEREKVDLQREIQDKLDRLGIDKRYWNDGVLKSIIESEIKLPSLPSIEDMKNDVTIAAIDSDFNVDEYLKSQLEKW